MKTNVKSRKHCLKWVTKMLRGSNIGKRGEKIIFCDVPLISKVPLHQIKNAELTDEKNEQVKKIHSNNCEQCAMIERECQKG